MSEELIEALEQLDHENDDHWTADKLPKVDALGLEGVTRKQITDVAPLFTRDNLVVGIPSENEVREQRASETNLLEEARAKLDEANKLVNSLTAPLNQAKEQMNNALQDRDEAIRRLDALAGERDAQLTIQEYLLSQRIQRGGT